LKRTDPSHGGTLEDLRRDTHLYQVPDFEEVVDIDRAIGMYIKQHYAAIFVNELASWWRDEAVYPKMTYELFNQWFDVALHTKVFEMVREKSRKNTRAFRQPGYFICLLLLKCLR